MFVFIVIWYFYHFVVTRYGNREYAVVLGFVQTNFTVALRRGYTIASASTAFTRVSEACF